MARRIFTVVTFTPVAVADTTNFVDAQHMSLKGGSATQVIWITEFFLGGQASASAPGIIQAAMHSTVGATLTALSGGNSDVFTDGSSTAYVSGSAPGAFVASTTKPQADVANKRGNLSFNAFGGLVRKTWNVGEGPNIVGNTASLGEIGINGYTGSSSSALMGGHIEYEPK